MLVKTQADIFLKSLETRRRNPARESSLRKYRSHLNVWILPLFGELDLSEIENGKAKQLVQTLVEAKLSATTIESIFNILKELVKSAVDPNGNQLYPRVWNTDFIDLPIVSRAALKAPVMTQQAVQQAISRAQAADKALYSILAGTGLRIGEALALSLNPDLGNVWLPSESIIRVRSTVVKGKLQSSPKTQAGIREVDVPPVLNTFLTEQLKIGKLPSTGLLFQDEAGGPANDETVRRNLKHNGVSTAFHSFRRFRITHLEASGVPSGLQRFWTGHAAKDVHEDYIKFQNQIETRKLWAEKAGLGFRLEA